MRLLSVAAVAMAICKGCGLEKEVASDGECQECRAGRLRPRMKSMSHVLDTKSFMLPASRNILWVWTAVTLGVLLLGETLYLLLAGR